MIAAADILGHWHQWLIIVLMIATGILRIVDVRKELAG